MEVVQLYPSKSGEYVTLNELVKEHAAGDRTYTDAITYYGKIDHWDLIDQGFKSINATGDVWRNGDVGIIIRPERVVYHSSLFKNPWITGVDEPETGQLINEVA